KPNLRVTSRRTSGPVGQDVRRLVATEVGLEEEEGALALGIIRVRHAREGGVGAARRHLPAIPGLQALALVPGDLVPGRKEAAQRLGYQVRQLLLAQEPDLGSEVGPHLAHQASEVVPGVVGVLPAVAEDDEPNTPPAQLVG